MEKLPHTRSCFVCGEFNAAGLKLPMESDRQRVYARWIPRSEHVGFAGVIHGGISATVLDELMAWACAVRTGRFAFCVELTVRYQAPVRPGTELRLTGELVDNRRDRMYMARAEIQDETGTRLASASGKYIPVDAAELSAFRSDFLGDLDAFLHRREGEG